jgi:5-formyltetrahydrofolate cyclo-ligase
MTKNYLRQKLLTRRGALSADKCLAMSREIQARFIGTELFQNARALGLYSPICNEVLTEDIFFAALKAGKKVVFPRVCERLLEFVEVQDLEELCKGAFGIKEPIKEKPCPVAELDLLIVPGVVFDVQGGRLGYGQGFYDRVLQEQTKKLMLIGLCYEIQLVTFLPKENHDVLMDAVVTERRLVWREKEHLLGRSEF